MNYGEFLTRLTIWLALTAYAGGAGLLLARRNPPRLIQARWCWTFGCVLLLAHVICAFSYYHSWSHATAYEETGRQTRDLIGWDWGGGIYLNYVVVVAWFGDVCWWWLVPESFARRSSRLTATWHAFLFFMVFNGTVVFGHGPVRWLGLLICCGLCGILLRRRMGATAARPSGR